MASAFFEQLYEDAAEADHAALSIAVMLWGRMPAADHKFFASSYWEDMPLDEMVDCARDLVDLQDWFSERLKLMLLEGEIDIRFQDPRTGEVRKVRDPDVIDFDDPLLEENSFWDALVTLGDENSSGEQNVEDAPGPFHG